MGENGELRLKLHTLINNIPATTNHTVHQISFVGNRDIGNCDLQRIHKYSNRHRNLINLKMVFRTKVYIVYHTILYRYKLKLKPKRQWLGKCFVSICVDLGFGNFSNCKSSKCREMVYMRQKQTLFGRQPFGCDVFVPYGNKLYVTAKMKNVSHPT